MEALNALRRRRSGEISKCDRVAEKLGRSVLFVLWKSLRQRRTERAREVFNRSRRCARCSVSLLHRSIHDGLARKRCHPGDDDGGRTYSDGHQGRIRPRPQCANDETGAKGFALMIAAKEQNEILM